MEHVPKAYFAKGSYCPLGGRAPFPRLVNPGPEPGGPLYTLNPVGQARFGPPDRATFIAYNSVADSRGGRASQSAPLKRHGAGASKCVMSDERSVLKSTGYRARKQQRR